MWTTPHLKACGWYLECDPSFTPTDEVQLRQGLQLKAPSDVVADEFAGLEEPAKEMAIRKRQEENQKMKEKITREAEKAAAKEEEKRKKAVAKEERRRSKQGKSSKPNVEAPASSVCNLSAMEDSPGNDLVPPSPYALLSEETQTRGPLRSLPCAPRSDVRKLILNTSMEAVLANMNGPPPTEYQRILNFCRQVISIQVSMLVHCYSNVSNNYIEVTNTVYYIL